MTGVDYTYSCIASAVTAEPAGAEVALATWDGKATHPFFFPGRGTCAWFARHRGERAPCKHVLPGELVRRSVRVR